MVKVSVIIPVYGVEKYIERCARSLFEQTLEDIEYIFVNDCTKDSSIEILERVISEYESRKGNIKIVNNLHNLGLPQSRKTGLQHATGEYIAHCDSDDWVDRNLYEKLYESATTNQSDIVVCDFLVHRNNGIDLRIGTRTDDINKYIAHLLFQRVPVSMSNKLIKREIYYRDVCFPTDNMGEDMGTTLQLITYCNHVSHIEGTYYHYDGRTVSITRDISKEATLSRALQASRNVSFAIRFFKDSDDEIIKDGITHLKFMQRKQYYPIIHHKDAYNVWKQTFPEINKDVLFKRSLLISTRERIKFFLILIGIFPILKKILK